MVESNSRQDALETERRGWGKLRKREVTLIEKFVKFSPTDADYLLNV